MVIRVGSLPSASTRSGTSQLKETNTRKTLSWESMYSPNKHDYITHCLLLQRGSTLWKVMRKQQRTALAIDELRSDLRELTAARIERADVEAS
eukprot:2626001-Amphidinium_carterae.1